MATVAEFGDCRRFGRLSPISATGLKERDHELVALLHIFIPHTEIAYCFTQTNNTVREEFAS